MYIVKQSLHLFLAFVFSFLLSCSIVKAQQKADTSSKSNTDKQQASTAGGGDAAKGKELFVANCKQCHAISSEVVIGPGLQGIEERRPVSWLIPWIHNSQKVIASGDKYAVELYNKYNKTQMTSFDGLSEDDIKGILAYIKAGESVEKKAQGPVVDNAQPGAKDNASSEYFNIILVGLVVVLILVIVVLAMLTILLSKFLNTKTDLSEEDKELVTSKIDFVKFFTSGPFLAAIGIIAFLVISKVSLDAITDIGVYKGYAPKQPIAFSHKLHAGQYEIACQYCHTTVYAAKGASIPSANICMNCHNAIKQGSPEIKKIYSAILKDQPIEWVRIHNLPDLAYFNHSQHTNVAGLACENCHGDIKNMEIVEQYSPLTMGWCIDCHRKTTVNSKDNAYYDRLLEAHSKAGKGEMKVVDIGGLECSKCHY